MAQVIFCESRPKCDICGTRWRVQKTHQFDGSWQAYCASCLSTMREVNTWAIGKSPAQIQRFLKLFVKLNHRQSWESVSLAVDE